MDGVVNRRGMLCYASDELIVGCRPYQSFSNLRIGAVAIYPSELLNHSMVRREYVGRLWNEVELLEKGPFDVLGAEFDRFKSTIYRIPPQVISDIIRGDKLKAASEVFGHYSSEFGRLNFVDIKSPLRSFFLVYFVSEKPNESGILAIPASAVLTSGYFDGQLSNQVMFYLRTRPKLGVRGKSGSIKPNLLTDDERSRLHAQNVDTVRKALSTLNVKLNSGENSHIIVPGSGIGVPPLEELVQK